MMKLIKYVETPAFKKKFKKLQKKFKTLADDLETAKRNAIELLHIKGLDNRSIVAIPGHEHEAFDIYKLRKFACKALKGKGVNSGIRIIYAFNPSTLSVTFIEIYFKTDQANEDKDRIDSFLKALSN